MGLIEVSRVDPQHMGLIEVSSLEDFERVKSLRGRFLGDGAFVEE